MTSLLARGLGPDRRLEWAVRLSPEVAAHRLMAALEWSDLRGWVKRDRFCVALTPNVGNSHGRSQWTNVFPPVLRGRIQGDSQGSRIHARLGVHPTMKWLSSIASAVFLTPGLLGWLGIRFFGLEIPTDFARILVLLGFLWIIVPLTCSYFDRKELVQTFEGVFPDELARLPH